MKSDANPKELINAEIAARSYNTKAKNVLKAHNPKDEDVSGLIISFYCECSDRNCSKRVPLTIKQYEAIHRSKKRFVIAKGHDEPRVEAVKVEKSDYAIVEKPALKD